MEGMKGLPGPGSGAGDDKAMLQVALWVEQTQMLLARVTIGHASQIIGHDAL